MSIFNGEINKFRIEQTKVSELEKTKSVKDYLKAIEARDKAENSVKEIAKEVVSENPEHYLSKENQTLFNREGLTVKGWPSYTDSFDLANISPKQFEELKKLQALTIDKKVFDAHLSAGRIDENLKSIVHKKVFKSANTKITLE